MEPLVVLPVFNEEKTIENLITQLRDGGFNNILIIDDASDDNTNSVVRKLKVDVISLPFNMGAWSAIRVGFKYAVDKGYKQVITMDADGQHIPQEIPKLINGSKKGADIVIGSCTKRLNFAKRLCYWIFKTLSGLEIHDFTSGFRLYNNRAFAKLSAYTGANLEYQDMGVLIMAKKLRLKMLEVPVEMKKRMYGQSRIFSSLKAIVRYVLITFTIIMVKAR